MKGHADATGEEGDMGFGMILLVGLTGLAAILMVGRQRGVFAGDSAQIPSHPTSPMDEAEHILAGRYARGEIAPDEYMRMLVILRR